MRRQNPAEKLTKKRQTLIARTAAAFNVTPEAAAQILSVRRRQSVRLNPLVAPPEATRRAMEELGWRGEACPWMPEGYTIENGLEALRDSQLVASGAAYIQNAASWLPVLALDPQPGQTVLDACAAPGGKTSHIAALTGNRAAITANDNSRPRLAKLRATTTRMNVAIESFTLFDAQQLRRKMAGEQYDRILLDAPCSGEGLMRLSIDKDFSTWSVAHIKRLESLQKRLISQAWHLLKPGGILVYSTCTIAPEENEAVIDYALRSLPGAAIIPLDFPLTNRVSAVASWNHKHYDPAVQGCLRLAPSQDVEAFFVCKLVKVEDSPELISPL